MAGTTNSKFKYILYFLIAALLIAVAFLGYWHLWWDRFGTPLSPGTAGDMFGALTSLFTGLAFAGVIITMLMQNEDLELQRRELQETREEIKGQKEQLIQQNKFIAKQNFENTFFQMLAQFNQLIADIEVESMTGRDALGRICRKFRNTIQLHERTHGPINPDIVIKLFEREYDDNYADDLGNYFRVLYNMLEFIARSNLDEDTFGSEADRVYVNFLRAQLSGSEVTLLFFDALSKHGKEKMRPYVEQYNLIKHLPRDVTEEYKAVISLYELPKPGVLALNG